MNTKYTKIAQRIKTVTQYGFGQSIVVAAQLLLSLIIIKKHDAALWGSYVELLLWVNIPALILYFGNKSYLLKAFSDHPQAVYQTWFTSLLSRGVLLIAAILVVIWIPLFQTHLLLIIAWIFLLYYNQSFESLIIHDRDFKLNIYTELARNSLLIIGVLACTSLLDLHLLLLLVLGASFLKAFVYSIYYFKKFDALKFTIDSKLLLALFPFFIPMFLGTIRTKTDAYYGTLFFTKEDLSKYQIFISLMTLIQLGATYTINPYLKNFYRAKQYIVTKLEKQSTLLGLAVGIAFIPLLYVLVHYLYDFHFSLWSYAYAFLFVITVFIHILLISEFYKYNKQMTIAYMTAFVACIQILIGYFLIRDYHIEGALGTKVLGQWLIIILLLIVRKKHLQPA